MKCPKDVFDYFSKSALSPVHKIEKIANEDIEYQLFEFIESLPSDLFQDILESPYYQEAFNVSSDNRKAKLIWFTKFIAYEVNKTRIKKLVKQNKHKYSAPYHLDVFDDLDKIDDNLLINLNVFDALMPGQSFPLQDMKFTMCQSIGGVNSSYWIAMALKNLHKNGHKVYVRLDPLLYNSTSQFEEVVYLMRIWGVDLSWDKILNLRSEDHGQWIPSGLGNQGVKKTEYIWRPVGSEVHLTIEEIPKPSQISSRGSRYLHAIFDKNTNQFVHCDGAIRVYDKNAYKLRDKHHLKHPTARKIGTRVKIFDVKSNLDIGEFIAVCCNFYVWNEDVIKYFTS